jgi:hypothetical protein
VDNLAKLLQGKRARHPRQQEKDFASNSALKISFLLKQKRSFLSGKF